MNNTLSKQLTSVVGERQKENKREGIQEINLVEREINHTPDLYTQTQAHVHVREMRKLIQDNFSNKVVPYFDIISRMITKEAELKNSHYVFYHAAPSITAVMADLYTQLEFHFHPETQKTMDNEFRFLRFQGESKEMPVREFVVKEMRESGLIDDSGKLGAYLLSVNLSMFGNVGSETECTWYWFLESARSVPKPDIFEKMMEKFGLTKKYINEIIALDDILATKESSLLQIFVPKEMVDDIVYLAWIRGIPATGPIMDWIKEYQSSKAIPKRDRGLLTHTKMSREALATIFKKEQEKNPLFKKFMKDLEAGEFSTYAFLRAYCSKPYDVPYLNETEGRMLFTKEGLLNPHSGIKFYRYFTTSHKKLAQYTTKLNAIVQKLIAEKEGQTREAPQVKPMPSSIKPQPSPVVTPKEIVTPQVQPKQTPITRPLRAIKRN